MTRAGLSCGATNGRFRNLPGAGSLADGGRLSYTGPDSVIHAPHDGRPDDLQGPGGP